MSDWSCVSGDRRTALAERSLMLGKIPDKQDAIGVVNRCAHNGNGEETRIVCRVRFIFCQSCSIIAGERNVEEKLAHLFHAANAIYCPEHLYLQLLKLDFWRKKRIIIKFQKMKKKSLHSTISAMHKHQHSSAAKSRLESKSGEREPERERERKREQVSERISLALSGALSSALSGSLAGSLSLALWLSLVLSLPISVSGYLWSMCFFLIWHFCWNHIRLPQLSRNIKIRHFLCKKWIPPCELKIWHPLHSEPTLHSNQPWRWLKSSSPF